MKISQSSGNTPTERYLKRLCEKSFLSMWSYAGIYNDKGKGQEICDLLVVFGNSLVIFSDKAIAFPSNTLEVSWKRWYRKAITESAKQVFGAERWILEYPGRLFLDQACTIPFPLNLPSADTLQIHRVVVAHSIADHCKEYFGGGSGSLVFDSECDGDQQPFTIGDISREKGFIHILDDTSLEIVLKTLDTAPDLIDYLTKKEKFVRSGRSVVATGEEEFLGNFLEGTNDENEHDFLIGADLAEVDRIILEEGYWQGFEQHPRRTRQRKANKVSYFWDDLIEKVSSQVVADSVLEFAENSLEESEKLLRLLAKENRTKRRFLSESFLSFLKNSMTNVRATRKIVPESIDEPFYLFLTLPYDGKESYKIYRTRRREMLLAYCSVLKNDHMEAREVVGIGTESGAFAAGRSYDFVYLDARRWPESRRKQVERTRHKMIKHGFLAKPRRFESKLHEYPDTVGPTPFLAVGAKKGRYRNALCICGSGRKSKRCCASAA